MRLFGWLKRTTEKVADGVDAGTGFVSDPVKVVNDVTDPITEVADDVIESITDIFGL